MSAEVLRQAASLMRERAEAAQQQPWIASDVSEWITTSPTWEVDYIAADDDPLVGGETVALANYVDEADAKHIASWHLAVALAVANWLAAMAARCEAKIERGGNEAAVWSNEIHALNVARAYLGES